jgi:nucleoside-diphosphate-sugar epimerase/carbamoylphosphate synthase large subunit
MKSYTIGISCIGSGVGESVINSCRLSGLPLRTIGLGTNAFAYGAYACDAFDYTPTIYAPDFVDKLIERCIEHQIDFLIPGRDDEAHIYAQSREKFSAAGIKILAAGEELIALCRDKERMSRELNPVVDIFVKCYQKESLPNIIESGEAKFPLIAKPRSGFASMGVEIIRSKEDLGKVTDDHIVQELAMPLPTDPNYEFYIKQIAQNKNPQVSEISIQVVLSEEGELLGKMASFNKLNNGVPIEIVPYDDDRIWEAVERLLPVLKDKGLVGPLNIQGRITNKGLKIFEMNPRFTGITGLRALMGFNEVEACIRSWLGLGNKSGILSINNDRFGIRQTADKVVAFKRSPEAEQLARQVNGKLLKSKRTLLVTGASGYLGRCLIHALIMDKQFQIIALGRDRQKLEGIFGRSDVHVFDYDALINGELPVGSIDIAVHTAFARPHCPKEEIAERLAFTNSLFFKLAAHQIPSIINISSQSVYGQAAIPWKETTAVAPNGSYAQAKYATELMLASINGLYPHTKVSSVRLGTLAGGQEGLVPVDLLSKFVLQTIKGEPLTLHHADFPVERMDVRDAAQAIVALIKLDDHLWQPLYNVGQGTVYKLRDVTDSLMSHLGKQTNGSSVPIVDQNKPFDTKVGMDISKFRSDTGWQPLYDLHSTIGSLFQYFKST